MSSFKTSTEAKAKTDINAHILKHGGVYSKWYAGIAKDPEERLFTDHKVSKTKGTWIHRKCSTDTVSRRVEKHFLDKGCKGGPGGGDSSTKYVYAYKITSSTCEGC